MSRIALYFLHCTSVLLFYIDIVLTLVIMLFLFAINVIVCDISTMDEDGVNIDFLWYDRRIDYNDTLNMHSFSLC